jgi:hypothetical protein
MPRPRWRKPARESKLFNVLLMFNHLPFASQAGWLFHFKLILITCKLGLIWLAESTASWFFVRKKYYWLAG